MVVDSEKGEVRLQKGGRAFVSGVSIFMGSIFVLIAITNPFSAALTLGLLPIIILLLLKYMKTPIAINKISSVKQESVAANEHVKVLSDEEIDKTRVTQAQSSGFSSDAGHWLVPIGIIILIFGLFWSYDIAYLTSKGINTTGTIVDKKSHHSDGGWTYSPVVVFLAKNGTSVRFEDVTGSSSPSWHIGDKVEVKYDPLEPDNAIIDSGVFNFLGPIAILVFGLVASIAGITQLLKRKKRHKPLETHTIHMSRKK